MSTTVAISAAALASSSSANLAASQARRSACEAFEMSYRSELATVEQKQQYSECVQLLHPQPSAPMTGAELLVVKAVIVLLMISVIVGAFKGWRDGYDTMDRLVQALLTGFMGAIIAAALMGAGALAVAGITYLIK